MVVSKKGSGRNQEVFPIFNFTSLYFRLLDSDKDTWMDLNKVYNMVWMGQNNLKSTQGIQIVSNMHT